MATWVDTETTMHMETWTITTMVAVIVAMLISEAHAVAVLTATTVLEVPSTTVVAAWVPLAVA